MPDFTPTQQRIFNVLRDGLPHHRDELRNCLYDTLGPHHNIHPHLTAIRQAVRPRGEDVICVLKNRQIHYQYVRLIGSPAPGGAI